MKVHTLDYACILSTDAKSVFAFHTDTRNLPFITPEWISVDVVSMEFPPKKKSIVSLDIKRFGITTRWDMEIAVLEFPSTITDRMIKGPFRYFQHQRHFIPLENNETLMRETISIVLPFGWLGEMFYPWIKKEMDAMFEYRHKATQSFFAKKDYV